MFGVINGCSLNNKFSNQGDVKIAVPLDLLGTIFGWQFFWTYFEPFLDVVLLEEAYERMNGWQLNGVDAESNSLDFDLGSKDLQNWYQLQNPQIFKK